MRWRKQPTPTADVANAGTLSTEFSLTIETDNGIPKTTGRQSDRHDELNQ